MNQLTEEQRERLNRVRARARGGAWAGLMQEDIDFLLSLLDSQTAGDNEKEAAKRTGAGIALMNDAATAMRDACVEKVRAIAIHYDGVGCN